MDRSCSKNSAIPTALLTFECHNIAARVALALHDHFGLPSRGTIAYCSVTLPWPSLRRNRDLLVPSTGHLSPFLLARHGNASVHVTSRCSRTVLPYDSSGSGNLDATTSKRIFTRESVFSGNTCNEARYSDINTRIRAK